jgi:hypothetical protein
VKRPLIANYTRRQGERLRLECEFEFINGDQPFFNPNDFTLYWVKNYQELLHSKKGLIHIIRKNMTSMYVLKFSSIFACANLKLNFFVCFKINFKKS